MIQNHVDDFFNEDTWAVIIICVSLQLKKFT